jgi:enoyl-CoA hydratase/carnithine racemase
LIIQKRRKEMGYVNLILEKKGNIARLTLNRSQALNALNVPLLQEMKAALEEISGDEEIDVVILTGAGRAFCAGMDLKALAEPSEEDALALALEVFDALENLNRVVIAAVNGYALTGGLELALACDFIIASEKAVFGDTHARVGLIPGGGDSQKLPRILGMPKAKELLFTSEFISAEEAGKLGLANRVVPADKLEATCEEIAEKIVANDRAVVRKMKALVNQGSKMEFGAALLLEKVEFNRFRQKVTPEDIQRRMQVVMEKGRRGGG